MRAAFSERPNPTFHFILNTPTGSGKSLVALALQFKSLCQGRRSYYTGPIKALTNEKFLSLCHVLGPENVGMITGDATVNHDAPVICCTAEILANIALRDGEQDLPPHIVSHERFPGQHFSLKSLSNPATFTASD